MSASLPSHTGDHRERKDATRVARRHDDDRAIAEQLVTLTCDMQRDCTAPVTHIDEKGWAYCAVHGPERRASGIRCRKLTGPELKRLRAGLTLERY